MKIEIDINEQELIKLVAKEYARLLYEKYDKRMFGFESEVGKMVKTKALKVLKADAKFNKTVETLLKDKEFVKQSVSKIVEEAARGAMRGGDSYD